MAKIFGEVIPTPGGEMPYKVLFTHDEKLLVKWPCSSMAEGEARPPQVFSVHPGNPG